MTINYRQLREIADKTYTEEQWDALTEDEQVKIELYRITLRQQYLVNEECTHSRCNLIPVHRAKYIPRNKQRKTYSDTTYVCERCGSIIETAIASSLDDFTHPFFEIRSLIYQMRMIYGENASEKDTKVIDNLFEELNYLESDLLEGYGDLLNKLDVKKEW